jgi:hypothetical protein
MDVVVHSSLEPPPPIRDSAIARRHNQCYEVSHRINLERDSRAQVFGPHRVRMKVLLKCCINSRGSKISLEVWKRVREVKMPASSVLPNLILSEDK